MTPRFQFTPARLEQAEPLARVGLDRLEQLVDVFKTTVYLQPDELSIGVRKVLDTTPDETEQLVELWISLIAIMRELGLTASATVKGFAESMQVRLGEKLPVQLRGDGWVPYGAIMEKLLESDALQGVAKMLELAYAYGKLWRGARILTDIRPLYSRDGKEIKGGTISFTMLLDFDDQQGQHRQSLAMDEGDVNRLMEDCKRALEKAEVARKTLADGTKLRLLVSGRTAQQPR